MEPIPPLPSPLHNTAMNGLVITTTGFPRPEKEELQQLIRRMSGIYSNNYHQDVTHLVVKMVGSEKYKVNGDDWRTGDCISLRRNLYGKGKSGEGRVY